MMLRGWLLVCSMMSISPDSGHVVAVPTNQKAGHVPQLEIESQTTLLSPARLVVWFTYTFAGRCATSRMKSP